MSRALPAAELARARAALERGAVVCVPTETTYGLAVDARVDGALERLLALKGGRRAPVALIAADLAQARALARVWPEAAARLAAAHWPGPLTVVVPARAGLPPALLGPGGGVGVRVAGHGWPRALAAAIGAPVTATSANPSGRPPATTVAEARAYFGAAVAVYLDGGVAAARAGSTVVEIDEAGAVRVLRAGVLPLPGS